MDGDTLLTAEDHELLDVAKDDPRIEMIRAGILFARHHEIRCTGSPLRKDCGFAPLTVIILHGRASDLLCPECSVVMGHVILYMGHGAFTQFNLVKWCEEQTAGLDAEKKAQALRNISSWSKGWAAERIAGTNRP